MPGSSTLAATFDGSDVATLFPNSFGTYSETGGRGRVQANNDTSALVSDTIYDFDGLYSQVFPDTTSGGFTYTLLGFYGDESNRITIFYIDDDALYFEVYTADSQDATTLAFDPVEHAWWRIEPSGANLLYQTSPDGTTWTTRRTVAAPAWLAGVTAGYVKFELSTTEAAGLAEADNINTPPEEPEPEPVPADAFPAGPLPIRSEILIDGVWTDYTDRVRGADPGNITIRRGFSGEQGNFSAGTCQFTLNNADGLFSFRNPSSALFGKLGRNTRFRHSVVEDTTSLRLLDYSDAGTDDYDGARAWTADKASLDITGDLDIRIDIAPDDWDGGQGMLLASKYVRSSDERSWLLGLARTGTPILFWSTDGTTANRHFAYASEPVTGPGRTAIRVTLDVNNGASGHTVTFYTSDTIDGSWTQLGDTFTDTGTTSVYSGTAPLEIGTADDGGDRLATITDYTPFIGKVYAFELYSGIGGTLVAQMDATAQDEGTTSWSDGLTSANTWTLDASAEISAADYRFHGNLTPPSQSWDGTGQDVTVQVPGTDIFGRLGQASTLSSAIYRNLVQHDWDGYWPCEDGFNAASIGAAVGSAGQFVDAAFSVASDFPGTKGALIFSDDDGTAEGVCRMSGAKTGTIFVVWYFKLDAVPASSRTFFSFDMLGGTIRRLTFASSSDRYTLTAYDVGGDVIGSPIEILHGTGGEPDQWLAMRMLLVQDGANVDYFWGWYPQGAPTLYGTDGTLTGSQTLGRPRGWNSPAFEGKFGMELAHIGMSRTDFDWASTAFTESTNAYVLERARDRLLRLCGEENVPCWWVGRWSLNNNRVDTPMGPQTPKTLQALLVEIAEATGGMLYAPRDKYGVAIRDLSSMVNRTGPEFDYSAGVFGTNSGSRLTPDENFTIQNDITASQTDGTSVRVVKESGTLNINDPDDDQDGVGVYPVTIPRNVGSINRLTDAAQWARTLGTWDEARWTSVPFELARGVFTAALRDAVTALELGHPLAITDLPDFLPPEDVQVYVRGYTEVLRHRSREIIFNTAPYAPYLSGVYDSTVRLVDSGSTTLAEDIDTTETAWNITTADEGDVWSTSGVPYRWLLRGEIVTVTAMTSPAGSGPYTQTATVTRSVNGVVTTHLSGDEIHIYQPARYAPGGEGGDVVAAGEAIYAADLNQLLDKPMVRLVQQSAQSISDETVTNITFGSGSEEWDTHNFHSTSSNTSRITPTVAGYYRATGGVVVASSSLYYQIGAAIAKNGTAIPGWVRTGTVGQNLTRGCHVGAVVQCDGVADYIELQGYQNISSSVAVNTSVTGSFSSYFELEFLRPL